MPQIPSHDLGNRLLGALSVENLRLLEPHLTSISMPQGTILSEAGDEIDQVYFPKSGMVSMLAVTKNGKAIETATIGREGVVGAMAGLGLYHSQVRIVVQLPIEALRISSAHFRYAVANSEAIRDLCIYYNEVLLIQARVTAACNALHPVEARFARWLLQSADRAECVTVSLTQELLSEMLGIRRTSVTEVAGNFQQAKIISVVRGKIVILDRGALERRSCECYETLLEQAATLGPRLAGDNAQLAHRSPSDQKRMAVLN
jgi:CRP-like cAMP-binding protein